MSRYPRTLHIKKLRHPNDSCVPCVHCGSKSEYIATIALTKFRGEDECYHICKDAKVLCDEEEFDQLFRGNNADPTSQG